ncbi:C-type lectin 8 [Elysia marginata]|uniref:C-type lectin 8 n=1 Tax=Elysia marginata TaxID=1093978 RepID=A0AAV4HL40_9GAST|nr:C-type lectin 8 [Elysia marginata]
MNKELTRLLPEHPSTCPFGYKQLDDHCFLLMTETMTFFDATVACDVVDGKLVQVTSSDDLTRVEKFLSSVGASVTTNIWLGATDLQVEGTWKYLSHGSEDAMSTGSHWAPSYPRQDKTSNCATLNQAQSWQWTDSPCSYHEQVLCEVTLRLDKLVG